MKTLGRISNFTVISNMTDDGEEMTAVENVLHLLAKHDDERTLKAALDLDVDFY